MKKRPGHLALFFLAGVILLALLRASGRIWLADDAYISFRYARNLLRGAGLVFNSGEYVEGITNLLWTLLLAFASQLFAQDSEQLAPILNLAFFALFLLAFAVFALRRKRGLGFATIAAISLNSHQLDFGTSGLETSFFLFFIWAGILLIMQRNRNTIAFWLPGIAIAIRPDGIIFAAIAAAWYLLFPGIAMAGQRKTKANLALFVRCMGPPAILVLALTAFRLCYYGDFLPNTFYSRSVTHAHAMQGLVYIAIFFQAYWHIPAGFLIIAALFFLQKHGRPFRPHKYKIELLLITLVVTWLLYLIQIGGDFMFGRFMLPILPALLLLQERLLLRANLNPVFKQATLVILFVAGPVLYCNPYRNALLPVVENISEEARIYSASSRLKLKALASPLKPAFARAKPSAAFGGAQAALVYYLGIDPAIEAEAGLTDRFIAGQAVATRGKVGHEKSAPDSYLKKRKTQILLHRPAKTKNRLKITGLGDFDILCYEENLQELEKNPDMILQLSEPELCSNSELPEK